MHPLGAERHHVDLWVGHLTTEALRLGAPLQDVQDALGHADPRTTRRYDRSRHNLDRSPNYLLASSLARQVAKPGFLVAPERPVLMICAVELLGGEPARTQLAEDAGLLLSGVCRVWLPRAAPMVARALTSSLKTPTHGDYSNPSPSSAEPSAAVLSTNHSARANSSS